MCCQGGEISRERTNGHERRQTGYGEFLRRDKPLSCAGRQVRILF